MCSGLTELPTEREGGLAPSGERAARVGGVDQAKAQRR